MNNTELTIKAKIKYVQDTLFVISGKWKLSIMIAVSQGNHRFRDIQRNVPSISTRVLSKELKELELNKLLSRKVDEWQPKLVEYAVTPYCKSLAPVVESMIEWGRNHRKKIAEK
ncbi:MAG TPA: helix-turn-helix domain-containing protein [Pseudobacter sp.]|nr:helix-turn-helix domain-containing protein [Pseudobacter sp.]